MKEFFIVFFILAYFIGLLLVVIFDCVHYKEDIGMRFRKRKGERERCKARKFEEAVERETERRMNLYMNTYERDALILWVLHEACGFGPARLKRFYGAYIPAINEYCKRWLENGSEVVDDMYIDKMLEYGISVVQWDCYLRTFGDVNGPFADSADE